MTGPSRRAVLAACGAGMAALAGCSQFDVVGGGDDREFDADRLAEIGAREVPTPPDAFPVAVPDAMAQRHRDRARTLLDRVPANPDLPNGTVVERLRRERERVLDRLDPDGDEDEDGSNLPDEWLDRLGSARYVRAEAAMVEAAYRAATGEVTPASVADRQERLRGDLLDFEADWTYRGDDPAIAVVLHRELEELRRDVRRGVDQRRAVPDDPVADVFRVGEIVRDVEEGRAALTDALDLRRRYREGLSDAGTYRNAISAAVGRIETFRRSRYRGFGGSLDPEEPPFDRSIEGTPAARLYREATVHAEGHREDVETARRRGDLADAVVESGHALASLRALEDVVAAIESEEVGKPTAAEDVAAVRREATEALTAAWGGSPTALAVELAWPAYGAFREATGDLGGRGFEDDDEPTAPDADRAYATFVYAARYAETVPETVDLLDRTLEELAG